MHANSFVLLGLALFCFTPFVRADDTWIDASSGTAHPLSGHPSIRMVGETVRIRLPEGIVHARFVFHNEGAGTTVLMGFPEEGKPNPHKNPTHLRGFRSTVDGRPVKVFRLLQRADPESDLTLDDYHWHRSWWVKRVHFAAGQTHVVTVQYHARPGWDTSNNRLFDYILATGRAWKGPIGYAKVILDVTGLKDNAPVEFEPAGYSRESRRIVWRFHNLEPDADGANDIRTSWFSGFAGVRVNHRPVSDGSNRGPSGQVFRSIRRGDEVLVSARTAADWLGARLAVTDGDRTVQISRGASWAEFTLGRSVMRTQGGNVRLVTRIQRQHDNMLLPLRPLIEALGGTSQWTPDRSTLNVSLRGSAGGRERPIPPAPFPGREGGASKRFVAAPHRQQAADAVGCGRTPCAPT